jgi:hypothetical protein
MIIQKLLVATFVVASILFAGAQTKPVKKQPGKSQNPVTTQQKTGFESAVNDPLKARIYTLKNGMKVYLSVYKNAPRIQTYIKCDRSCTLPGTHGF